MGHTVGEQEDRVSRFRRPSGSWVPLTASWNYTSLAGREGVLDVAGEALMLRQGDAGALSLDVAAMPGPAAVPTARNCDHSGPR